MVVLVLVPFYTGERERGAGKIDTRIALFSCMAHALKFRLEKELAASKKAVETHSRNITFQTITLEKTKDLIVRSEMLLKMAKNRVEYATKALEEMASQTG